MAKNVIRTSPRIAKIASKELKNPRASKRTKALAGEAEENRKKKTK